MLGRVSPAKGRWEEGYTGRSPRQRSTTLQFSLHKQSGKRNEEKEGRAKDILYVVYTDTHRWRAANRGGNEKKKLNFSQVRNIVDFSPPVEIGGFSLRGKPLGADYYVVLHGRCRTALLPQRRNKGASHMQVVVLPMNDSVAGCAGDFKEMKIGGGLSPFLRRAKGRSTSTIKVKKMQGNQICHLSSHFVCKNGSLG